ncbi:uncharacterized protein LOC114435585 [Parambassis ranga]|uniref:Uncharacterized protein LOC114435585 n=1 Tax=Parambassis ranga TaxID=210632 RepID=A0A6P7IE52_9TELE|nr:uncharacterized protein LOC114435585 [Parambassis ranga]
MSHHMYNPYMSVQAEESLQRETSHLGLGSSLNSSGESSANSGGTFPSLQTLPESSTQAGIDDNIERSVDIHVRTAREQVRHQPLGQDTLFASTQREDFLPLRTDMTSKPKSSGSQRHAVSGVQSVINSLDWLPRYRRPTEDDSYEFYSSSVLSSYPLSGEREGESSPGDDGCPLPDKPATSTESFSTQHTVESAENILVRLGLEKEDLAELSYYREDQITPENFPFVLRQIRIQKAKRAVAEARSQPCPESKPTSSMSEKNTQSTSTWTSVHLDETTLTVVPPCKVIDYGHISKYSGGVGDDTERTGRSTPNSGEGANMLQRDTQDNASCEGEPPQTTMTEVKRSVLMSSCDQYESATDLHSPYSSMWSCVASPRSDPAKPLLTQPTQSSSTTFTRVRSVICKPLPSKEERSDCRSSENQTSCGPVRVVHSSQPACVLLGSKDDSHVMDKTP